MSSVAVIGSGTWGTAIAHLIAGKNVAVRMWTRSADVADVINAAHRNPRHLPDVELAGVTASASFAASMPPSSSALRRTCVPSPRHARPSSPPICPSSS